MHTSSLLTAAFLAGTSHACSRVAYNSGDLDSNRITVGRSMDWIHFPNSSIWAFPAGLNRTGHAGTNSISWTSKYGSVVTSMYDLATVDGINTAGLAGNTLYLADSDYGTCDPARAGLSIGLWQQYFMDNYATVEEVVTDLYTPSGMEKFQIATKEIVESVATLGHLALTDRSGDNAIMEYIDGKLILHHSKNYTVMTNEPSFDSQLAILQYWAPIADVSLPGTDRPADRFVRLSYYASTVPASPDSTTALAVTAGMIRAVSVPFKPVSKATPNVSPTYWRTYADTRDLLYFYESAAEPLGLFVDVKALDLGLRGETRVLSLNGTWTDRVGNVTGCLRVAEPFEPINVDD